MATLLTTIERPGSLRDSFRRIFSRNQSASRSSPGIFSGAQNTNIQHATFTINQYGVPVPDSPYVEPVVGQLEIASRNTAPSSQAHERDPSPRRESPDVYVDCLMPKLRGYPLWIPSPNESLPTLNRILGVSVGDVGMLTPDGAFNYLFNIFHPATHSINAVVGVPDLFVPFTPAPVTADIEHFVKWNAGSFLADASIVSVESNDRSTINLEARGVEGGVLMIPEDLHVFKLRITTRLRKYVDENKVEWYRFVKHTLGHDIENGDLRVVYGCGKSSGFGIATAFNTDQQEKTRLSFSVEGSWANTSRCPYRWTHLGSAEVKTGPSFQNNFSTTEPVRNQCLFVNTLDTWVSSNIWKSVEISTAMDVTPSPKLGEGENILTTKSSGASSSSFTSELVCNSAPFPYYERAFHPSVILQNILEIIAPGLSAYTVCDDDWVPYVTDGEITRKSSGQYIYASVVAKYVKSSRHRPDQRLDVALSIRPASKDLPFAELDALYTHILSNIENIERTLNVISFEIIFPGLTDIDEIEQLLGLYAGEIDVLLHDLPSVIGYKSSENFSDARPRGLQLKIYHASLVDYLLDSARSNGYFINMTECRASHIAKCFRFLSSAQCQQSVHTARAAISCLQYQFLSESLNLTEPLFNAIKGFSISRTYNWVLGMASETRAPITLFQVLVYDFLPILFKFLKKSNSPNYLELYRWHQVEYDSYLRENLQEKSPDNPTSLLLALIAIYRKLPIGALHASFRHYDLDHSYDRRSFIFQLGSAKIQQIDSLEYLSDFLCDPQRSQAAWAGPKLFAHAAKYCLLYLCDHTALAQKAPPWVSAHQRLRRINTPWMWHRRVLHRKINRPIYVHIAQFSSIGCEADPAFFRRLNSEKYYLALSYVNHFLPRAGRLDELVDMCQKLTFASRSQDFPRTSTQARLNMKKYAVQWV